jgi:hypothetical protein
MATHFPTFFPIFPHFPPFSPINIIVSILNNKKDYTAHLLTRKPLSRNIWQHIATDIPLYIKTINILYKNKFYIKNEKKSDSGFDGCKSVLDIYKCPKTKNGVRPLQKT